jgi:hypothetical protein
MRDLLRSRFHNAVREDHGGNALNGFSIIDILGWGVVREKPVRWHLKTEIRAGKFVIRPSFMSGAAAAEELSKFFVDGPHQSI